MTLQQLETLPCEVINCNQGLATISITLPSDQINGFVALLTSLAVLFRGLGWKTKTNIEAIHERENLKSADRNERLLAFESVVCESFQEYLKKGNTPREALSLTVSSVHTQYEFSSYDIVKNCLSKNKLLKKTGFYKNRHKYDE